MSDEFAFMVTPLVFDLKMSFVSSDYEISEVYGSGFYTSLALNDSLDSNVDKSTLMQINTLFPSISSSKEGSKGGIVVLSLRKKNTSESGTSDIELSVAWKDRKGKIDKTGIKVKFYDSGKEEEQELNTHVAPGLRKAVALTRYANLMRSFALEKTTYRDTLAVSDAVKKDLETMQSYLESELKATEDKSLLQEIHLLEYLQKFSNKPKKEKNVEQKQLPRSWCICENCSGR